MLASAFGIVVPGLTFCGSARNFSKYGIRTRVPTESNTGAGFEFQVIAAVVIGGVSINGGVGSVPGTVLGVLLLGCVAAALPLLGIPGTTQNAIYGAVILIALLFFVENIFGKDVEG